MRKLATVRRISDLTPIDGADMIVLATIDGWNVVVKKEEFKVGDLCVYFEIDSHLPIRPEFEVLRRNSLKTVNGREGFRIKTVRLRKQISQGFALPVHLFFNDFIDSDYDSGEELSEFFCVGSDLTEMLDIGKYEPRIPAELEGKVKGNYPSFVPRTDQERCQNILRKIFTDNKDSKYEVTTKLHGASFTAYLYNGKEGVCSRRWDLQVDDEKNLGNTYVRMYLDSNLPAALRSIGGNYAVQGELMGPGICKNREGLDKHILYIFDIYDIDAGTFLPPEDRHRMMATLYEHGVNPELVHHVPIMALGVTMDDLRISTVGELLAASEFPSISHETAEGKVYKRMDGNFTFKVVSNLFLLKDEEGDDE